MFRPSICPSSGVLGCILLHMVFSTDTDTNLHTVHKTTHRSSGPQPQHLVLNTICSSIQSIQPNIPEDGHVDARNMQSYL